MPDFSPEELQRYRRHIVLRDFGGPGQARLKQSAALIIGAGGLGSPAALYLAAAGIGRLGIIDDDTVSLSNLQRQILHATSRIGQPKVDSAARTLAEINPHVQVEPINARLTPANALDIIGQYDVVLDGSDNFATRYLVSDACFFARKPLIWAAIGQFTGQIATFRPYDTDDSGTPLPGYRDFLPEPPPPGSVPSCAEAGVIGALPGVIGAMQAMEAIKEITGIGSSLAGWLILYEALAAEFMKIRLHHRPDNPLTGDNPTIRSLADADYASNGPSCPA